MQTFGRMNLFLGGGSPVMSLGQPVPVRGQDYAPSRGGALSQSDVAWKNRGTAAVARFDNLLKETAGIGNAAARAEIMAWVGSASQPGTPAERYKVVVDDLAQGSAWEEISTKRVVDLEAIDDLLATKVKQGEQAFAPTAQPDQAGQILDFRGAFTPTGIVLGTIGVLGLLVVPLVVGE